MQEVNVCSKVKAFWDEGLENSNATDEEMEDQGGEEDSGGPATNDGNEDFYVDADLLL